MKVFLEYDGDSRHWKYCYYDSGNFRTTTEGFKNHILALAHARDVLGNDIKIINK